MTNAINHVEFFDTATVAETRRRLPAEGHHVSESALRGWVRQGMLGERCCSTTQTSLSS